MALNPRSFQIVALVFFALALSLLVVLSMRATGGRLIYSLDDPYIHLAVAENILRGGYGINATEFSSPSSSVLYPFLLALSILFGLGDWGPLLIGAIAGGISVWLVAGFFWTHAVGPENSPGAWPLLALAPLIAFALNAIALPMTGMEHPLHILASVAIVIGLEAMARDDRVPLWLSIAIVLCPLVRFEGMALSLTALALLAWCGHRRMAFGTGLVLGACLLAYGLFMHSLGLPLLPSSVLVKSKISAAAIDGGNSSLVAMAIANVSDAIKHYWGRFFVTVAFCLVVALGWHIRKNTLEKSKIVVFATTEATLIAHLCFGAYGWFNRYEVYAVAVLLLGTVYMLASAPLKTRSQLFQFTLICATLLVAVPKYVRGTFDTIAASRDIYRQQFQMHRFATRFFPFDVAVNDLGWVSYDNDAYVLDLWGLGSEQARKSMTVNGRRTIESTEALSIEHHVEFSMVYDEWMHGAIPLHWCRIGELNSHPSILFSGVVTFYLIDLQRETEMRRALAAFGPTLPEGATLAILPCPAAPLAKNAGFSSVPGLR